MTDTTKNIKPIKQWQTQNEKITAKPITKHAEKYLIKQLVKKEEEDKYGNITIKRELEKIDIYEKMNETAKLLKTTEMQNLLQKINEIEEQL